ncbi:uncharacterized protein L3040_004962 [Drepanopeziza brunnea f. sp. 'multigermtubi']|uniref:uncharacterized protein n=1 Tax=Drepanopeziza brunnea f. sp. 'multigermtubi' TaxID=698441 RepID=UPI002388375F|nr:hypothetical protein L3040_004962 [Drepanopeziza brunnea f. sp. 'multigermtubi']
MLESEAVLNGKLVLLHQKRVDVPDSETTVLGCTLWSTTPEDAREVVLMRVQDFEKITRWTVDDHNASHEADLAWLRHQALEIRQQNVFRAKSERARCILVVTHHAPSLQKASSPGNTGNPWSSAFASYKLGRCEGVGIWTYSFHYTV